MQLPNFSGLPITGTVQDDMDIDAAHYDVMRANALIRAILSDKSSEPNPFNPKPEWGDIPENTYWRKDNGVDGRGTTIWNIYDNANDKKFAVGLENGNVLYYAGKAGSEFKYRAKLDNGDNIWYGGPAGQEYMIRKRLANGNVSYYNGTVPGKERKVYETVVTPRSDSNYEGNKGQERKCEGIYNRQNQPK